MTEHGFSSSALGESVMSVISVGDWREVCRREFLKGCRREFH